MHPTLFTESQYFISTQEIYILRKKGNFIFPFTFLNKNKRSLVNPNRSQHRQVKEEHEFSKYFL